MANRFLTETLVDSVKRRSLIPVSQTTFQDSDIIALANEELGITIVPDIQAVREDMFLALKEQATTASVTDYRLPERAIGSALKSILYSTDSTTEWELPRIPVNRKNQEVLTGMPSSFYLKGDYVVLNPSPASGGTLKLWYYCRPSEMVPSTSVATITAISDLGSTLSLTVDADLTGVLSPTVTADITNIDSPSIIKYMDVAVSSVTSSTIVISDPGTILVNDTISLSKTTNVPMIPQEFHPVLAQAVSCRLLEALGDLNKLQLATAKLMEMRSQAMKLIANRVETATEHFSNPRSIGNSTGRFGRRAASR